MRCLVTAGPTYEPLDQVRRLTNFSTGRLGSDLANFLTQRGHEVVLLSGEQATWGGEQRAARVIRFGSTEHLRELFQQLATEPCHALFHAAAVSDFKFGKVWQRLPGGGLEEIKSGKISSRYEGLLAELVPAPKLITELRNWFPDAFLAGWKYEVDGERADAIARAVKQLAVCQTNLSVVNGPAYGQGFGLVSAVGHCDHCENPPELFIQLAALAETSVRSGGVSPAG